MKTYHRTWLEEELPKLISSRFTNVYTLDLGCKDSRYRELLGGKYVGVDINPRIKRDVVLADAHHLPFAAEIFSLVLTTELLEHVEEPKKVINEIYRVSKSGGELILSVPYLNAHAHGEYWRFSETGLEILLNKLFKIEVARKIGGFFTNFFSLLFFFITAIVPKKLHVLINPFYVSFRVVSKNLDQFVDMHYAYVPSPTGILIKARRK